jgi:hypothetical protein
MDVTSGIASSVSSSISLASFFAVLSLCWGHVLVSPALILERLLLPLLRGRTLVGVAAVIPLVAAVVLLLMLLLLPARGRVRWAMNGGERLLLVAVLKLDGIPRAGAALDLTGHLSGTGIVVSGKTNNSKNNNAPTVLEILSQHAYRCSSVDTLSLFS